MKTITRLSLALIMFSLFSISYLVTSVFAQEGAGGAPTTGDPCMVVPAGPDRDACYATTPPPTGMAPGGMAPGGMAPGGMAPGGMAPGGMAPGGMAPAGTPVSGGISGWIKGGLKALGIGSEPGVNPAGVPGKGAGMPPTGMAPAGTPDMQGEDCAAMPTPKETADCWKRQNDPLLGAPAQ